jgi:hypothetical protein
VSRLRRIEIDRRDAAGFARLVAEELLKLLEERGTLQSTGISSRRREEVETWRDQQTGSSASSDPTVTDEDFDSWSEREARSLLASMRRKKKREQ